MLRRVLLALGLLFAALGVAVAVAPPVAGTLRLPDVPLLVVAALAVVLALATYTARKRVDFRDSDEAAVRATGLEDRFEPPRPGTTINAAPAVGPWGGASSTDDPLRERLRFLAVRVLADAEGWDEDEAHRRLDDGTWTDDRAAAALFADGVSPAVQYRVASLVGVGSTREREVQHVLAELERLSGVGDGGD